MKNYLLVSCLFIFLILPAAHSQNFDNTGSLAQIDHTFGDVSIAICPNAMLKNHAGSPLGGGLKLKLYVSRRFSFDSELIIGDNYTQLGPGIFGIPLWVFGTNFGFDEENNSFKDFLFIASVMLLSAEHFSYHIPAGYNTDISPYMSLLRLKQITFETAPGIFQDKGMACFAFGLEMNKYYKRFFISPYIDFDVAYNGDGPGLNIGINLGYYFPNRK